MIPTTATATRADQWGAVRATLPALSLGLCFLGVIFWQEVAAAVNVWSSSTAYNHCFLVLPIASWLAYDRRRSLTGLSPRPLAWIAVSAVPVMAVWLLSEQLGIMEGRQLMAIVIVMMLFLSVLGWQLGWLLSAPLLYLLFLVPFGSFLTGTLQNFTSSFIVRGLDLLGIVNISDGNTIEIPEGVFFVAEACAGLRFLIASVAFGVLYAVTFYRTSGRRVAFILASIIVPIIANGFRALGIVVAGHWIGSAEAAAADHIIYGWLFFSIVTLLLILAGLPFRQDQSPGPMPSSVAPSLPKSWFSLVLPAFLLVVVASIGPLLARQLDHETASGPIVQLPTITGCTADDAVSLHVAVEAGIKSQRYLCGQGTISLMVAAFPPRTNPMAVLAVQRTAEGYGNAEDLDVTPVPGAPGWHFVSSTKPPRIVASAFWLDGKPASGGLRSRLQQAADGLLGIKSARIVAAIQPSIDGTIAQQREVLVNYLDQADRGGSTLSAQLAALSSAKLTAAHF